VSNLQLILSFFRKHKLEIIYVTLFSQTEDFSDLPLNIRKHMQWANNWKGSPESEILSDIKPKDGEFVINKTTLGAFASSGIDTLLRTMGVDYILVAGVTTEFCPGTTAREAAERGYHVIMLEDCCASLAETWHRTWLTQFQLVFGRVATAREAMAELNLNL
jgi:nicotinamidase-related amidase